MDSRINNGMCRCCASEGTFKDLASTYHWMGEEEIYAEMLKECFDIHLNSSDDGEEGGICEVCITQLRNASNFKKQVLHTEKQFKKRLHDKLFKNSIVKVEVPGPDEDALESDNDNNVSEDFSGTEFEVPIKEEIEEPKPKKRAAKATSSRAKKAKIEHGETSTKRKPRKSIISIKVSSGRIHVKEKSIINISTTKDENHTDSKPKMSWLIKRKSILLKHLENIREMLKHSNATPIKYTPGVHYSCCFCNEKFLEPMKLKLHTIHEHDTKTKLEFMKDQTMPTLIVKMDITGLKCTICDINIEDLDALLDHLSKIHDKQVHIGATNYIVPFKFENGIINCCICKKIANSFKVLLEHMNTHFKNFVCDQCDAGFVNQRMLRVHSYRHVRGEFTCPQCSKVFDTKVKMKAHERAVHVLLNKRNKCSFCEDRFTDYTKKNQHEVEVHGVAAQVLRCQACPRTFSNQRSLSMHTKGFHLMEKRISKSS